MKKKVIILNLILMCIISACGTKTTTKSEIENAKNSIPGTTDIFYTNDRNPINTDLNKDGNDEEIIIYAKKDKNSSKNILKINGNDYKDDLIIIPDNGFRLIDVNNDNNLEIILENENNTFSQILEYDKDEVKSLGIIEGGFNPDSEIPAKINGDGQIEGFTKTDILETCYIPVKYVFVDGIYSQMIDYDKIYDYTSKREGKIISKVDFTVHTEIGGKNTIVLPAGTAFDSNKTDASQWANVITEDGNEYWLNINGFQLVDDNNIYTWDAFDNLYLTVY